MTNLNDTNDTQNENQEDEIVEVDYEDLYGYDPFAPPKLDPRIRELRKTNPFVELKNSLSESLKPNSAADDMQESECELLMRQARTLDKIFQFTTERSIGAQVSHIQYNPEHINSDYLNLALKAQQQCADTIKKLQAAKYMESLVTIHQVNKNALPHPLPTISDEQTIDEA